MLLDTGCFDALTQGFGRLDLAAMSVETTKCSTDQCERHALLFVSIRELEYVAMVPFMAARIPDSWVGIYRPFCSVCFCSFHQRLGKAKFARVGARK